MNALCIFIKLTVKHNKIKLHFNQVSQLNRYIDCFINNSFYYLTTPLLTHNIIMFVHNK